MMLGFEGRRKAAVADAVKRAQQLAEEAMVEVDRSATAFLARLESRLALPPGAIGRTHVINLDSLAVEPVPSTSGRHQPR